MPKRRVFRVLEEKPMEIVGQLLELRPHRTMDQYTFFAMGKVLVTTENGKKVTLEDEYQRQGVYASFAESFPAPPANLDFTRKTHLAFTKSTKGKQVMVHEYTTTSKDKLVLAEIYEDEDGSCELATCPSQFMEVDASRFTDRALAISGIPAIFPGFACTASDMATH